ncbi:MAG: hypothetical protein H6601_12440 [Flavobacteriales bacterium]|nr:hypothetical protein [Flavobacteriales bacterium]
MKNSFSRSLQAVLIGFLTILLFNPSEVSAQNTYRIEEECWCLSCGTAVTYGRERKHAPTVRYVSEREYRNWVESNNGGSSSPYSGGKQASAEDTRVRSNPYLDQYNAQQEEIDRRLKENEKMVNDINNIFQDGLQQILNNNDPD